MNSLRIISALVMICLLIFPTVALGSEIWMVLLDVSGSMGDENDPLFKNNLTEVEKIINSAGKSTNVVVLGLGKRSNVQFLKAQFPKIAGSMNRNIIETRQQAIKKLHENISANLGSIDRTKYEVHGGIVIAGRWFAEAGEDVKVKRLHIVSDMVDNQNFSLDLKKMKYPDAQKKFLPKLNDKQLFIPDLSGVDVYVYAGFKDSPDMKSTEQETATRELKQFWQVYFKKTKGNVVAYKTTIY